MNSDTKFNRNSFAYTHVPLAAVANLYKCTNLTNQHVQLSYSRGKSPVIL